MSDDLRAALPEPFEVREYEERPGAFYLAVGEGRWIVDDVAEAKSIVALIKRALASPPHSEGPLDAAADDVRYAGGNGTSDYWRGFNDGIDKLVDRLSKGAAEQEDHIAPCPYSDSDEDIPIGEVGCTCGRSDG